MLWTWTVRVGLSLAAFALLKLIREILHFADFGDRVGAGFLIVTLIGVAVWLIGSWFPMDADDQRTE